jgi:hypothetical protein
MTKEELEELITELRNLTEVEEAEWSIGGSTRYETNVDGRVIVFERRNNADTEKVEGYVRNGDVEQIWVSGTEEFDMVSNFVTFL